MSVVVVVVVVVEVEVEVEVVEVVVSSLNMNHLCSVCFVTIIQLYLEVMIFRR